VSGASPGGAAGAILAGPAADRFGRKKLLIAELRHQAGTGKPGSCFTATRLKAIQAFYRQWLHIGCMRLPASRAL
jgi:hypothetical protein